MCKMAYNNYELQCGICYISRVHVGNNRNFGYWDDPKGGT